MRITGFVTAFALILGLLASVAVFAQYDTDRPSKLNIRVGLYRLSDSDARANFGKQWLSEEVLYDYKQDALGRPVGRASIGFAQANESHSGSMLSGAASKLWWKDTKGGNAFYGGIGAGVYKMKAFGDESAKPGAQLFGGYAFGANYFAEIKMTMIQPWTLGSQFGGPVDINMSGFTIGVGTRQLF